MAVTGARVLAALVVVVAAAGCGAGDRDGDRGATRPSPHELDAPILSWLNAPRKDLLAGLHAAQVQRVRTACLTGLHQPNGDVQVRALVEDRTSAATAESMRLADELPPNHLAFLFGSRLMALCSLAPDATAYGSRSQADVGAEHGTAAAWLTGAVQIDLHHRDLVDMRVSDGSTREGWADLIAGRVTADVATVEIVGYGGRKGQAVVTNGTFVAQLFYPPRVGMRSPIEQDPPVFARAFGRDGRQLAEDTADRPSDPGDDGACYVDPDGRVVIGVRDTQASCEPAVRWR